MKSLFKALLAILGLFVIFGAIGLTAVHFSEEMVEVRAFEKRFSLVEFGDPEKKVITLLGEPDAKETAFRIGQEQGFEEAYARARASGSAYYLVWTKGMDVVFSVGIDPQGAVRVKEYGGT